MSVVRPQVALVSGASRGIGMAVARRLADGGCQVVMVARTPETLQDAAEKVASGTGAAVMPVAADMSRAEGVAKATGAAFERFGRIDIAVSWSSSARRTRHS
jgi:3-oxoacyl-[acyl-carrier protein] reductase